MNSKQTLCAASAVLFALLSLCLIPETEIGEKEAKDTEPFSLGFDGTYPHLFDASNIPLTLSQLKAVAAEGNLTERWAAVSALAALGRNSEEERKKVIVGYLKEVFDDPDASVRVTAAQHVISFGDPSGIPVLIRALSSSEAKFPAEPPTGIKDYSTLLLEDYTGLDFGFDEEAWLMWWNASKELAGCLLTCRENGFASGECRLSCSMAEHDIGSNGCWRDEACCCRGIRDADGGFSVSINASNQTNASTTTTTVVGHSTTTTTQPPAAGSPPSGGAGATSCSRDECEITITLKVAFAGEATEGMINKWETEIEGVWNGGRDSHQTYGECKCSVTFDVITEKVATCNPPPQGSHCIHVTTKLPKDTSGNEYVAYMYGVSQRGSGVNGWWSTQTSRRIPGSNPPANYVDAAHEAGHMLGLGDDYDKSTGRFGNNIMGTTSGANAKPTQEQIDKAVENNCDAEDAYCPEKCCCPNGVVDSKKGEECDPKATPNGCSEDAACTEKCTCQKITPRCGDGRVYRPQGGGSADVGGEECDPSAKPTGCGEDETCTENCTCIKKDKETPAPADTVEPSKAPFCGDGDCSIEENCETCDKDCGCRRDRICSPSHSGADNRGCVTNVLDIDNDGLSDSEDNCPESSNTNQSDLDSDGIGDVCDPTPIDCLTYCINKGYMFPPDFGKPKEMCLPPDIEVVGCQYVCKYSYWYGWRWEGGGFSCCCRHITVNRCPSNEQGVCECPTRESLTAFCEGKAP